MASDIPRRLRRTAIGQTPPPPEALVRAGVAHDRPPVELTAGEVVVPTHEGAGPRSTIAGNYRDRADVPKGSGAPSHPSGAPFELED